MYTHKIGFISLSIIGVAAVLMVITAPTLENQASAVSQPVLKKISAKDPPSKVKKDPPRKRWVCMKNRFGKRVCRWVPWRGPVMGPRPTPLPGPVRIMPH
jgi:hypothetical protein